jgi:hypothetical protein
MGDVCFSTTANLEEIYRKLETADFCRSLSERCSDYRLVKNEQLRGKGILRWILTEGSDDGF